MSADNEVLWIVTQWNMDGFLVASIVFRTRAAGRQFANAKNSRRSQYVYGGPKRAKWGPEQ